MRLLRVAQRSQASHKGSIRVRIFSEETKVSFLVAAFTVVALIGSASAQTRGSCMQKCSQDDRGNWTCNITCK
jgi:hypothetical protein